MRLTRYPNPLRTKVELTPHEQEVFSWKIMVNELVEMSGSAHCYLDEGTLHDPKKARTRLDYLYAEHEGKSKLEERVKLLVNDYFLPDLLGAHYGDCTCVAMSCGKCHAESYLGLNTLKNLGKHSAHKIENAFGGFNGTKTIEEALASLGNYNPKAPTDPKDLEVWDKVGGFDKHVPRWKGEAAHAFAWLKEYHETYFKDGALEVVEDLPEHRIPLSLW